MYTQTHTPGFLNHGVINILDQISHSRGAALCIIKCLVSSVASTHFVPVTAPKLCQSKMFPDIIKCHLKNKTASGLQLICPMLMRNNWLISNTGKKRTLFHLI